jgi:hypothetical protein
MTAAWWDVDAEPAPVNESAPPTRELVPEGEHSFKIKQVIDSADRLEVRLVHDDRRYGWVFCKLPKSAGWAKRIAAGLAAALGVTAAEWPELVRSGDMAGRRVRARVYHKAGNQGGTFVNVGEFLAADAEQLAAVEAPKVERAVAPPARRAPVTRPTRTQAADAASGAPDDDIPF